MKEPRMEVQYLSDGSESKVSEIALWVAWGAVAISPFVSIALRIWVY